MPPLGRRSCPLLPKMIQCTARPASGAQHVDSTVKQCDCAVYGSWLPAAISGLAGCTMPCRLLGLCSIKACLPELAWGGSPGPSNSCSSAGRLCIAGHGSLKQRCGINLKA